MTTLRPTFTVRSAVEACQISEKTLRRRLPALQQHGATVDARGRWRIPYEALVAVELKPGRPTRPDAGHDQVVSDQVTTAIDQAKDQADQGSDQAEIARLRAENELLRALVEAKDQALALALRQLPPGSPTSTPTSLVEPDRPPAAEETAPVARTRWWRRAR